jgi:putative restriction endonuclease
MRYWVGVTDKSWFLQLRQEAADEVNFWQPSAAPATGFLQPGIPFLFKLHYPDNCIVGGGYFVRFSVLPARIAWEAFERKNGVPDYFSLKKRIEHYRGTTLREDPQSVAICSVSRFSSQNPSGFRRQSPGLRTS